MYVVLETSALLIGDNIEEMLVDISVWRGEFLLEDGFVLVVYDEFTVGEF